MKDSPATRDPSDGDGSSFAQTLSGNVQGQESRREHTPATLESQ